MKITSMPLGILKANCYIITSQKNNAVVIDPGGQSHKLMKFLDENGITLKKILLTHGHFDHAGAVNDLMAKTRAEVYIHRLDGEFLTDIDKFFCTHRPLFDFEPIRDYIPLEDNDVIELDEIKIKVLHTPGHSKGSSIFIIDDVIFSGDTLFKDSCGRTDLYGGNYSQILASLKKIAALTGDYKIYTGHGEATTLNYERQYNEFMNM